MNKNQLIVMWAGIFVITTMLMSILFFSHFIYAYERPHEATKLLDAEATRRKLNSLMLIIDCVVVGVMAGIFVVGGILTRKFKSQPDTEKSTSDDIPPGSN